LLAKAKMRLYQTQQAKMRYINTKKTSYQAQGMSW